MKITMAHGSGGKSSEELMEQVFGRHFANPILDKMEDAAVLEVSGRIAFSTDTFVVNPLEFKGGNIGKLAICGTVNDLLMMGARPKYLTCGFILEEGLEVELLERVVATMADYARQAGVLIVAGDTKVVKARGDCSSTPPASALSKKASTSVQLIADPGMPSCCPEHWGITTEQS